MFIKQVQDNMKREKSENKKEDLEIKILLHYILVHIYVILGGSLGKSKIIKKDSLAS